MYTALHDPSDILIQQSRSDHNHVGGLQLFGKRSSDDYISDGASHQISVWLTDN